MPPIGPRPAEEAGELLPSLGAPTVLDALVESPCQVVAFAGPALRVAFQNRESARTVGQLPVGAAAAEAFAEYPTLLLSLSYVYRSGETLSLPRSPVTVRRPGSAEPEAMLLDIVLAPLRSGEGAVTGVLAQAVDVTSAYSDDERLRRALALNRMGLDLSRSLEVEQVTATVTRLAAEAFHGWSLLDLWQPDGSLRRVGAAHHDPSFASAVEKLKSVPRVSGRPHQAEAYSAQAARHGQLFAGELDPAAVAAAATSPEHAAVLQRLAPRWYMAAPIEIGPRRLGALSVVRGGPDAPFSPAERAVLEQFAERAAIALAHARDYDEQRQAALTLQAKLLPAQPLHAERVQFAVRYQAGGAGSEVGGDWYDTVALEGGSIGIAVGDVQGHDLAAAALMGQVRAVVHSHAHLGLPPARVVEEANAFVLDSCTEQLVTLTYLQVYPDERLVVWVRAGHLPAIVVLPDDTVHIHLGRGGLPLGVDAGARWQEETLHLPPGAMLALFTDGLVETPAQSFEDGVLALAQALRNQAGDDLELVADRALEKLSAGAGHTDDIALVLLRLGHERNTATPHVVRRLPPASSSAPLARAFVRDLLAQWGVGEQPLETAALLVTELISNAARESDNALELRLSLKGRCLRVSVFDDSHRLPDTRAPGPEETSGRGLHLVSLLSSSWGVTAEERGKVVWFELALPASLGVQDAAVLEDALQDGAQSHLASKGTLAPDGTPALGALSHGP